MRNIDININTGFFSLLGLLFIALKLVGVISWSWLWVLAPIWIPVSIAIIIILAAMIFDYIY